MPLVIAANVSKTYVNGEIKVQALKGLSFEIEPATFVSFVGPSGSGKTTILNYLSKPPPLAVVIDYLKFHRFSTVFEKSRS